jgi:transcriptional regulator with XRE-family HTH domain
MARAAEPEPVAELRRSLGTQLATFRLAADLTQGQLAKLVFCDRTTIVHIEKGRARGNERFWAGVDEACAADGALLAAFMELEAAKAQHEEQARAQRLAAVRARAAQLREPANRALPSAVPALDDLRRALLGNDPSNGQSRRPDSAAQLKAAVTDVHRLYQLADYDGAVRRLPPLLMTTSGMPPATGAVAYLAAAKLARKLGDAGLAWVAADRSARLAAETDRQTLVGIAGYEIAAALLAAGDLGHAEQTTQVALQHLQSAPPASSKARSAQPSVCGALLLLLAVMVARRADARAAMAHLREAARLADDLGQDGNWLWTGFGPTNVAIHELSVHVALGDTKRAQRTSTAVDTDALAPVLRGRRSQVHLDLATAAVDHGDDGLAVLHLLEAERVASQAVSRNKTATRLLTTLLSRERRTATPGLRALASRAGVLR